MITPFKTQNSDDAAFGATLFRLYSHRISRTIPMPRKVLRKERGIYEKVPGFGIWWIRFKVDGV
jgi:hypothetical protein